MLINIYFLIMAELNKKNKKFACIYIFRETFRELTRERRKSSTKFTS